MLDGFIKGESPVPDTTAPTVDGGAAAAGRRPQLNVVGHGLVDDALKPATAAAHDWDGVLGTLTGSDGGPSAIRAQPPANVRQSPALATSVDPTRGVSGRRPAASGYLQQSFNYRQDAGLFAGHGKGGYHQSTVSPAGYSHNIHAMVSSN
jgi:hypothetical protein